MKWVKKLQQEWRMNPNLSILIIGLPCGILSILALVRFIMQLSQVDFYNNTVVMIRRITDIYCSPLRALLPTTTPYDLASLVMAFVMQILGIYLIYFVFAGTSQMPSIGTIVLWSLVALVGLTLRVYFILLILNVVFSWVRPGGTESLADFSNQIIAPLLKPFHRLVPPMAGLDFSPMALFFLIYLLQSVWRSLSIYMGVPLAIIIGV